MSALIPKPTKFPLKALVFAGLALGGFAFFKGGWFYNESGYVTHVRTIFGEEKVVESVGYETKWFGATTPWKKALSIQSLLDEKQIYREGDDDLSANTSIPASPLVFLHRSVTRNGHLSASFCGRTA